MVSAVVLDSGPLGLLCGPRHSHLALACWGWYQALRAAGRRLILPEIADYEVRRELIRAGMIRSVARFDSLKQSLVYLPLTTDAMLRAAVLWAQARQLGQPTSADAALDGDVILAAQALTSGESQVIVATTNVVHLARFVPADLWENIPTIWVVSRRLILRKKNRLSPPVHLP